MLSEAKHLALPLRVNSAKNLRSSGSCQLQGFFASLRMTGSPVSAPPSALVQQSGSEVIQEEA